VHFGEYVRVKLGLSHVGLSQLTDIMTKKGAEENVRILEEVKVGWRKLYIWRFIIGHEHFNKSYYG